MNNLGSCRDRTDCIAYVDTCSCLCDISVSIECSFPMDSVLHHVWFLIAQAFCRFN